MANPVRKGALLATLVTLPAIAVPPAPTLPPHLDPAGQDAFREFLVATRHRAFALAPGGAYGWSAEKESLETATAEALTRCNAHTQQKCIIYAVDDRRVFDERVWQRSWGPYKTAAEAQAAPVGRAVGQRFPDLAFTAPDGRRTSIAALKGRVVILHFWGSWCAPCRREMPDLERLKAQLEGQRDVTFALLQAREPFAVSRRWARAQKISLPLFDSGSAGEKDGRFTLADGTQIADREIAALFPTTYVLDKHGIVVFSHVGPVHDWPAYGVFIADAARRSGQ